MSIIDKPIVKTLMLKGEKGDPGDLDSTAIVDNLTTNRADKVLSAKQGKVLNDKIDDVNAIKPSMYDTVALMKADTDLIDGDYAQTLGYYSANDGGGATYKVREITNEDVVDDGSIISLNNPNLIAELIIDSDVNVKQFGAYGDNTHDDTNAFKKAITFLLENNTLNIPYGHYLISDNLKIKDTLSLKGINGVPYLIYTANSGTLLTIEGHYNATYAEQEYDDGSQNSNAEKKYLLESLVLVTDSLDNPKENTIGLSFDTAGDKRVEGSTIYNVRIRRFEKGVLLPTRNFYINTFSRVSIISNKYGIYMEYGEGTHNVGERITFENGVLDGNRIAIHCDEFKYDMNIDNCSIDYNRCFINAQVTRRDCGGKISIKNCHYETRFEILNNDADNPHGIFFGNIPLTAVYFINNIIFTHIKEKQFIKSISGESTKFYFQNNCFWYATGDETYDLNRLFVAGDFPVYAEGNNLGVGSKGLPFSPYQIINKVPGMTYLNAGGTATLNGNNHLIDSASKDTQYIITNPTNISSYSISANADSLSEIYKPITFTNSTDDSSVSFELTETKLIEFNRNLTFKYVISGKNIKEVKIRTSWYNDDDGLVISEDLYTLLENNTIEDTQLVIPRSPSFNPSSKRPRDSKVRFKLFITGIEGKDVEFNAFVVYNE